MLELVATITCNRVYGSGYTYEPLFCTVYCFTIAKFAVVFGSKSQKQPEIGKKLRLPCNQGVESSTNTYWKHVVIVITREKGFLKISPTKAGCVDSPSHRVVFVEWRILRPH